MTIWCDLKTHRKRTKMLLHQNVAHVCSWFAVLRRGKEQLCSSFENIQPRRNTSGGFKACVFLIRGFEKREGTIVSLFWKYSTEKEHIG
jgi:hypothetical protein